MAPRFGLLPTILLVCLAATSAFHCSGTRRSLPVAAKVTPSRSSQLVLVQRSKEAQENIAKWGKILSQADTFDDSMYKPTRGNKAKRWPEHRWQGGRQRCCGRVRRHPHGHDIGDLVLTNNVRDVHNTLIGKKML